MSRDSALVSADWAEKNLDTPGVVFVEVDEDTTAYDGGHIPGAIKLDWKKDLQDPVRRDFVDKEGFEALLSARGIAAPGLVLENGCGLSRIERITATTLADVLTDAWKSQWMSELMASLPISGVDGTMKARNVPAGERSG